MADSQTTQPPASKVGANSGVPSKTSAVDVVTTDIDKLSVVEGPTATTEAPPSSDPAEGQDGKDEGPDDGKQAVEAEEDEDSQAGKTASTPSQSSVAGSEDPDGVQNDDGGDAHTAPQDGQDPLIDEETKGVEPDTPTVQESKSVKADDTASGPVPTEPSEPDQSE